MANQKTRIVFVAGGQGSGKEKCCEALSEHEGVIHLSVGEIMRGRLEHVDPNDIHRRTIREIMRKGDLVSPITTVGFITERIREVAVHGCKFVLLDGFPRDSEQVDCVHMLVSNTGCDLHNFFFHLSASEKVRHERVNIRGRDSDVQSFDRREEVFRYQTLPALEKLADQFDLAHVQISTESDAPDGTWASLVAAGIIWRQLSEKYKIKSFPDGKPVGLASDVA